MDAVRLLLIAASVVLAIAAALPGAAHAEWFPVHAVSGKDALGVDAVPRPDGGATLVWTRSGAAGPACGRPT